MAKVDKIGGKKPRIEGSKDRALENGDSHSFEQKKEKKKGK